MAEAFNYNPTECIGVYDTDVMNNVRELQEAAEETSGPREIATGPIMDSEALAAALRSCRCEIAVKDEPALSRTDALLITIADILMSTLEAVGELNTRLANIERRV